jgi:hypothetical protein
LKRNCQLNSEIDLDIRADTSSCYLDGEITEVPGPDNVYSRDLRSMTHGSSICAFLAVSAHQAVGLRPSQYQYSEMHYREQILPPGIVIITEKFFSAIEGVFVEAN